jgi:hypothetical protein
LISTEVISSRIKNSETCKKVILEIENWRGLYDNNFLEFSRVLVDPGNTLNAILDIYYVLAIT